MKTYRPELEKAGTHFFCEVCLSHIPLEERSFDERYCWKCCDLLMDEAEQLRTWSKPTWAPREIRPGENSTKRKSESQKPCNGSMDVPRILSTVNDGKITVDKITPTTPISRRGRKKMQLPEETIKELVAQGMGSKKIASTLLSEYGITVNYRTIARFINVKCYEK